MSTSMAENFQRYFSVKYAATPELKHDVFRTRFSVYCREFGYEPLDHFRMKWSLMTLMMCRFIA